MAGEVQSSIKVDFTSSIVDKASQHGGAGGSMLAPARVAGRANLMGSGGSAANYAAQSEQRWQRTLAKEVAQDKAAMAEIHRGLQKLEVKRALEVSSARRAEREAFDQAVRNRRGAEQLNQSWALLGDSRDASRKLRSASKSRFKSGLKAGLSGLAFGALQDVMPDRGGLHGAFLRVAAAAGVGALGGSLFPGLGTAGGAIIGGVTQTYQEIKDWLGDLAGMGDKLKARIALSIESTTALRKRIDEMFKELMEELELKLKEVKEEVALEMRFSFYRETRFVHVNLTGDYR